MEPKKQPKKPIRKSDSPQAPELKTEPPISEKDEVKQAEERVKSTRKHL